MKPEAEPQTEAEAEAKPEPEAEPQTEADAKPEAEPQSEAEPQTEADAKPEPETDAKPEAETEGDREPETAIASADDEDPAAEAQPTAADADPAAEPQPVTADADPTPQPQPQTEDNPAPEAEPVAAATSTATTATTTAPKTQATATTEATEATAAPTTPTAPDDKAPASAAAIALGDLEARAPALVGFYTAAGEAIQAHGLAGQRAVVYLVLDRSGSMRGYFKDGTVSHLADQALALSAHLDTSGTVPVVFFSTDIDGTAEIELSQHSGRIEELHGALGHMGRTNYHTAVNAVIEHYKASGTTDPAFVIFQTDGAPTAKTAAEKALCEAAGLPLFWQFLAFGDPEAKGFDFLRKLDTSPALAVPEKRAVDNTGFFHAGLDPRTVDDAELYGELLKKFPGWLATREQS